MAAEAGAARREVSIAAAGGVEQLLAVMREHPTDARVQECASWALANLAANDDANKALLAAKDAQDSGKDTKPDPPSKARDEEAAKNDEDGWPNSCMPANSHALRHG